jgi:Tol biopolymer transport system component
VEVTLMGEGAGTTNGGFVLVLDGSLSRPIASDGPSTFDGLSPGPHTLHLGAGGSNCSVSGDNPRTVNVVAGRTQQVMFTLGCTPAGMGAIRVSVTTTGDGHSLDGNGYVVVVDQSGARPIGINNSLVVEGVLSGSHTLRLDGIAPNCTLAGENPRIVSVSENQTVEVAFSILCAPAVGTILVKTFQEGGIDPDGYTISLDGGTPQAIGIQDSIRYEVAPGSHELLLAEMDPGCGPQEPNPQTANVTANGSVGVDFHVACPITGVEGRIAFYSDRDGDWEIFVMNADGTNPRQLTANAIFGNVHPAWSPDGTRIAFVGTRQDPVSGVFHDEILIIDGDGSNEIAITNHPLYDTSPGWSSSNRIVFQTNRDHPEARPYDDIFPDEIYTIAPDGTDPQRVTTNDRDDAHPDWSPDGQTIVYSSEVSSGNYDILTIRPDGSGIVNLTNHPASDWRPAWSPDGTRIAFHSNRDGNFEIYVMNADGTSVRRLTDHPGDDFHPSWSPDSRMIAFQSRRAGGDFDIYIMQADGTGIIAITNNTANDDGPAWTR